MECTGRKPERHCDTFEEEQRIRALEILSDNWPPPSEHDEAVACIEACAGIDTALLWPGAMGEMRDEIQQCVIDLDAAIGLLRPHYPQTVGLFEAAKERAGAILAKLNGGA